MQNRLLHHNGENLLPYDKLNGPRAFCPRPANTSCSTCPPLRLQREEAVFFAQARRARMAGVRRHWRLAKRLSPSLTEGDLNAWFVEISDESFVLSDPLSRILCLIDIRAGFYRQKNSLAQLRVDAAIWREIIQLNSDKVARKHLLNAAGKP